MSPAWWVIAATLAWGVVWVGFTFNRFIRQRNLTREAWSGVEVQLKRRHDLVPRLVECVKGYQGHEASLLETLAMARANAPAGNGMPETGKEEKAVTQTLRVVLAVAEAYPDLKAGRNFQELSAALIDTEDQLQYARRYYNGTIRDYAILAESFPGRLVARLFGFCPGGYFEVESSLERQVPEVKL